jgi:hypothetical protein
MYKSGIPIFTSVDPNGIKSHHWGSEAKVYQSRHLITARLLPSATA